MGKSPTDRIDSEDNTVHDLNTIKLINSPKGSKKILSRARAQNAGGKGHAKHAEKTGVFTTEYSPLSMKQLLAKLNDPAALAKRRELNKSILRRFFTGQAE